MNSNKIDWKQVFVPSIASLIFFTIVTGLLYPLAITGIAQAAFPNQANGSLITDANGNVIGSELIGQQFSDPAYFWGRLSATSPVPYNAAASSGSNYAVLNPALLDSVEVRSQALLDANAAADVVVDTPIPVDLLTASGSGLDPHISPAAAQYQIPRIAALRGVGEASIQALVEQFTEGRTFGFFGEPRVHVLLLNLALDEQYPLN